MGVDVVEMGQLKVFVQKLGLKQQQKLGIKQVFLADKNIDYLTLEWQEVVHLVTFRLCCGNVFIFKKQYVFVVFEWQKVSLLRKCDKTVGVLPLIWRDNKSKQWVDECLSPNFQFLRRANSSAKILLILLSSTTKWCFIHCPLDQWVCHRNCKSCQNHLELFYCNFGLEISYSNTTKYFDMR